MDILLAQKARKSTYSDMFLGLLVPTLLLKMNDHEMALDIVVPTSLLFIFLSNTKLIFFLSVGMYAFAIIVSLMESVFSLRPVLILGFVFCSTYNLMRLFSHSFTLGEALLLSHLSTVFIQRSSLFCLVFITFFLIERYALRFSMDSFLSVGFLTGIFLFFICHVSPSFSMFYKIEAQRILCYLSLLNVILLAFWFFLFVSCVAIVWVFRHVDKDLPMVNEGKSRDKLLKCNEEVSTAVVHSTDDIDNPTVQGETDQTAEKSDRENVKFPISRTIRSKTPFWMRKVFHLAAGLVYTTGLLWSPGLLALASVFLLILFFILEWIRRRGPKLIVQHISDMLDPFRDERDSGELIFTPIALLLGLSLPLWWPLSQTGDNTIELGKLCAIPKLHPACWSGVLSIAVGDSMAALVGRAWGRLRWPGTHRTFLGSTASFISQLAVWMPIARHEQIPWSYGLLPIVIGVLAEAYLEHIDNLVVPLIVMIAFPNSLP